MRVVGDPQKTHRKSTKLRRQDFKAFIALRYGSQIAEKWCNLLDFTLSSMDYETYCQKVVDQILTSKSVMLQASFDFYDANSDDRISDLDLFKIL